VERRYDQYVTVCLARRPTRNNMRGAMQWNGLDLPPESYRASSLHLHMYHLPPTGFKSTQLHPATVCKHQIQAQFFESDSYCPTTLTTAVEPG